MPQLRRRRAAGRVSFFRCLIESWSCGLSALLRVAKPSFRSILPEEMEMPGAIRIAVIDDHPMFREGAVQTFACMDDIEVVAEGATAADALRVAQELRPDVMLLDISFPRDGLDPAPSIPRTSPRVPTAI